MSLEEELADNVPSKLEVEEAPRLGFPTGYSRAT